MGISHPARTNAGPSTSLGVKYAPDFAQDDCFLGNAVITAFEGMQQS